MKNFAPLAHHGFTFLLEDGGHPAHLRYPMNSTNRYQLKAKAALAVIGALALCTLAAGHLLRSFGEGPEVLREISSPKGEYKVVHSVYLGGAIAPYCHDVLSVYHRDEDIDGKDASSQVYFGSCHTSGPAIRWISSDTLQIGFSLNGALAENIAELRLKPRGASGKVNVSFIAHD